MLTARRSKPPALPAIIYACLIVYAALRFDDPSTRGERANGDGYRGTKPPSPLTSCLDADGLGVGTVCAAAI